MRRWMIIVIILLMFILGAKTIFSREKPEQIIMREATLENILLKLSGLSKEQGAILKKLEQILANQAQIKDELKIIKVRASR